MTEPFGPGGRAAAAAAREVAERTARALTTGASGISRSSQELADGSRDSAGVWFMPTNAASYLSIRPVMP